MDLREVDIVLDAIGQDFIPASIDRAEFGGAIDWAIKESEMRDELSAHAKWKARYARAKKIRSTAERLSKLLADETGDWVTSREVRPTKKKIRAAVRC